MLESFNQYRKTKKWAYPGLFLIFLLNIWYGKQCAYLIYYECIRFQDRYISDFPAHIESGLTGEGYSLMEYMMGWIVGPQGGKLRYQLLGIFMAMLILLTIIVTWRFLCLIAKQADPIALYLGAFACNMTAAYFIPAVNPYRYLGLQSGNLYHNSTFLGMKLFGTLVLFLYFCYEQRYEQGLNWKEWGMFCISIILVNLMKPNFIVAFAPLMGLGLLWDLIRKKGKTFGKIFLFGLAVIPSVVVLIYEYVSLFPSGEGGGLAISPGYSPGLYMTHPVMGIVQSLAFPICILIVHAKNLKKEKMLSFTWAFVLVNYLVYYFIIETGERKSFGNLSWGYCYSVYAIFVVSMGVYLRDLFSEKRNAWRILYYIAAGVLLAGHMYFGIQYFRILLGGGGYY